MKLPFLGELTTKQLLIVAALIVLAVRYQASLKKLPGGTVVFGA